MEKFKKQQKKVYSVEEQKQEKLSPQQIFKFECFFFRKMIFLLMEKSEAKQL